MTGLLNPKSPENKYFEVNNRSFFFFGVILVTYLGPTSGWGFVVRHDSFSSIILQEKKQFLGEVLSS